MQLILKYIHELSQHFEKLKAWPTGEGRVSFSGDVLCILQQLNATTVYYNKELR